MLPTSDSQPGPGLGRDKEAGPLLGGTGLLRWMTVLRTSQRLCQLPLNSLSPSPSLRRRCAPQSDGSPSLHTPHSFSHVGVSPNNTLECFIPSQHLLLRRQTHTLASMCLRGNWGSKSSRDLRAADETEVQQSPGKCLTTGSLETKRVGAVLICSTGWFPWCEHFHHNSTSKFTPARWHHWAWHWDEGCTVALRTLCTPALAHLREAASLGFCLSAGHLPTALPVCFTAECSSHEGALHSLCPRRSLPGHWAGHSVRQWLLHGSRGEVGTLMFLEIQALLREGGHLLYLWKRPVIPNGFGWTFWLWGGRWIEVTAKNSKTSKRWFK